MRFYLCPGRCGARKEKELSDGRKTKHTKLFFGITIVDSSSVFFHEGAQWRWILSGMRTICVWTGEFSAKNVDYLWLHPLFLWKQYIQKLRLPFLSPVGRKRKYELASMKSRILSGISIMIKLWCGHVVEAITICELMRLASIFVCHFQSKGTLG